MSVINEIIKSTTRKRNTMDTYMKKYDFHMKFDNGLAGADFGVIEKNKMTNDDLNKNSSIIYKQNFQTLMTFLPAELVEKILDYETYKFPMLDVYKELLMTSKHPRHRKSLDVNKKSRRRYVSDLYHEKQVEVFSDFIYQRLDRPNLSRFKYILTHSDIYLNHNLHRYNISYLYKQLGNETKNIDGLLLYLLKKSKEYNEENLQSYEGLLEEVKESLGGDFNYFKEMLFNIVLNSRSPNQEIKSDLQNLVDNTRRLTYDKFGRWLDWSEFIWSGVSIFGKYGLTAQDIKYGKKDEIIEKIRWDFERNNIPIKIPYCWSKKKMLRIFIQEGREIFLKEFKSKYKKVLTELKRYCKNQKKLKRSF